MAITITITITSKSVIDYTQLQLQLSITPCLAKNREDVIGQFLRKLPPNAK